MRRRRAGARFLAVLGIGVAGAGLAAIFTDAPGPPSPRELAWSVTGEVGAFPVDVGPCRRETGRTTWRCTLDSDGSGLPVDYRVSMLGARCWRAARIGRHPTGPPERAAGCVDDVDVLASALD